jgi:hypothetical protein
MFEKTDQNDLKITLIHNWGIFLPFSIKNIDDFKKNT